jgi:hypothetical protein
VNDEEGFDPNDIADLETKFARIKKDSAVGYTVEFIMTKLAAQEMVSTWLSALLGDRDAVRICMSNYSYLVEEIMNVLQEDDD